MGTRTSKTEAKETGTELEPIAEAGAVAAYDFGDDAGKGFENQTSEDYGVPFIALLQSKSKVVEKEGSAARGGMLMLTDSEELFDGKTGLLFVPATTQHVVCEWKPRSAGGGLVARHPIGDPMVEAAYEKAGRRVGKDITNEAGNDIVETFYICGQLCSEEGDPLGIAVLGFNSTKIKTYQGIMGRLRKHLVPGPKGKVNPPLFANLLRVTAELEQRPAGSSYNFRIKPAIDDDVSKSLLKTTDPRYIAARMVRDMVDAGKIQASTAGEKGATASDDNVDPTGTF